MDGTIEVGGADLAVVDEGSGPALLFLHAFPLSSQMWAPQIASFRDSFRVVALDFPGFGGSRLPAEPASMDLYARRALRLLDALAIPSAAVVGLSMGGYVAFALHARAPERVAALALCDTRAVADTEQAQAGREELARAIEEKGLDVLVERILPMLLAPTAPAAVRAEVERIIRCASPAGGAAALRAIARRRDFTSGLPRIACPTLALTGEFDILTPPPDAEAMAKAVPGATLAVIPGAGHLTNLEAPDAFNTALRRFLEEAALAA